MLKTIYALLSVTLLFNSYPAVIEQPIKMKVLIPKKKPKF